MDLNDTNFESNDAVFDKLRVEILKTLERNLSPHLTYHCVAHTIGVLSDAILIATEEGVSPAELMKIKIAALCHDTGFMFTYKDHEEASCAYAIRVLPTYNIPGDDIIHIKEIIMATKIPQTPKDQCGKILADADLAYLGTEAYDNNSALLYDELKHYNPLIDLQTWQEIQIKFLNHHQYFTQYCIKHKTDIKNAHLQRLIYNG